MENIDVLVGCEESQAVTIEFRKLGIRAFSCDLMPCSGMHPEWHIQDNVLRVMETKGIKMGIFFPPCTHLSVSGAKHFEEKRADGRQQEGIDFFMACANAPIERIGIENPIGIMSTIYRKPDQIIHPYYFGDAESKGTCLWLKNLPLLVHIKEIDLFNKEVTHVEPEYITSKSGIKYSRIHYLGGGSGKERSKTYPGIAKQMATQWNF